MKYALDFEKPLRGLIKQLDALHQLSEENHIDVLAKGPARPPSLAAVFSGLCELHFRGLPGNAWGSSIQGRQIDSRRYGIP